MAKSRAIGGEAVESRVEVARKVERLGAEVTDG